VGLLQYPPTAQTPAFPAESSEPIGRCGPAAACEFGRCHRQLDEVVSIRTDASIRV